MPAEGGAHRGPVVRSRSWAVVLPGLNQRPAIGRPLQGFLFIVELPSINHGVGHRASVVQKFSVHHVEPLRGVRSDHMDRRQAFQFFNPGLGELLCSQP